MLKVLQAFPFLHLLINTWCLAFLIITILTGVRWYHCGFNFQFVNVVYHIDWVADIEKSLHPWDKSHLIMVYDPFNVLLDLVCYSFIFPFVCVFFNIFHNYCIAFTVQVFYCLGYVLPIFFLFFWHYCKLSHFLSDISLLVYKNWKIFVYWFCILQLYWIH